jgi:hypothetical protein
MPTGPHQILCLLKKANVHCGSTHQYHLVLFRNGSLMKPMKIFKGW